MKIACASQLLWMHQTSKTALVKGKPHMINLEQVHLWPNRYIAEYIYWGRSVDYVACYLSIIKKKKVTCGDSSGNRTSKDQI